MKRIKVHAEHLYEVLFSEVNAAALHPVISNATKVAIIVPEDLVAFAEPLEKLLNSIATIEKVVVIAVAEGETQKSIKSLENCWKILGQESFRRSDAIIGLGGGATTDLAGFVAATWLRGIKWGAIPTSLAGMVDAAIGGKTGINTDTGKNLVGSFYSPSVVIIDLNYLQTLPVDEFRAGLAEVIKCGFIADQRILELIEERDDFLTPSSETVRELIERAVLVKADVVSQDLKESYLRESLNYGHTLAHAIERFEEYSWRHGDAVAVGLAYIANLAVLSGIASEELCQRHLTILKKVKLPTTFMSDAWPELLQAMQNDKKSRAGGLRFVAISDRDHKYEVVRLEGISSEVLETAYERICT